MPIEQVEGISLFYEEQGQGTPVLLLHGLGSSQRDWEFIAGPLAASYRVLTPDVRGHGRSDKPPGAYGVPLFTKDIAALCDKLGLSQLHVVGLSMGGMIAFQLAVSRPDLVRSLVIVNSGPDMVPRTAKMWLALKMRIGLLKLFGPRKLAELLGRRLFPKPEQDALRERMVNGLGSNDKDVYLRATRGLIGWTVLDRLSEIKCPVLVLHSDHDYTPLSAKRFYVTRLEDAQLEVITDSGHAATLDQPQQVIEKLSRFFAVK